MNNYKKIEKNAVKYFQKTKKYDTIGGKPLYTTKKYFDYEAFHAECGFDLAKHSSIGCGGMADIVFYPTSIAELTELLKSWKKTVSHITCWGI